MAKALPRQSTRLIILLVYVAILCGFNFLAFGQLPPLNGGKGLWFYTGLASLLLGNLLVTPFYTKPVDAISYAVAAGIALYAVNEWPQWQIIDQSLFIAALYYCLVVIAFGFITILIKDKPSQTAQQWSNSFRILSDALGNQRLLFSIVILFAIYVFHRESPKETFVITLAWAIIVIIKPDEVLTSIVERLSKIWVTNVPTTIIGDIAAYQSPGIVLIRQRENKIILFGTPLLVKDPYAPTKIGIAIDYAGRDEALLLRAIEIDVSADFREKLQQLSLLIPDGTAARFEESNKIGEQLPSILRDFKNFVGIVASETSIERLYFEVVKEKDLEEGRLVEVSIGNRPVIYQIINGLTKEEIVHQKNTYGYARVQAQKIGIWDNSTQKFQLAKWLPQLNAPVFLKSEESSEKNTNTIGQFPGTSYPVGIKNIHELVTHNTAILGILGVGKSMLAIELVERMIAEKIKVICIDLTEQYAVELIDFYNAELEAPKLAKLESIGSAGKNNVKKNVEEGGSIREFSKALMQDLKEFANAESPYMLKIYNPSRFLVWRQDSKPYQDTASMASLTPTEITQIISETALKIVQEQGMISDGKARLCLVYEEAHSLVPEWSSAAAEGDKSATNGTARAILQGRKYGMGCLLITQRTANVTKTILNQCNSIFAMRTFDDTGKEFLSNYIGSDYANALSALPERHAIFYGKASTCENPVLIKLNDKDDFRKFFRKVYIPAKPNLEISEEGKS